MSSFHNVHKTSLRRGLFLLVGLIFCCYVAINLSALHRNSTVSDVERKVSEVTTIYPAYIPNQEASDDFYSSESANRSWFFKNGKRRPIPFKRRVHIWPHESPEDDRILDQLMYIPPEKKDRTSKMKTILFYYGLSLWKKTPFGQKAFIDADCPVKNCFLTDQKSEGPNVDAIVFQGSFAKPMHSRPRDQIWIYYFSESPYHINLKPAKNYINWTMTYRHDSEIADPYGRWVYYDSKIRQANQSFNYAAKKKKNVAWLVSNCRASNERLAYAKELKKHIDVDIYGACGDKKCPRFDKNQNLNEECFEMLSRDYKFYLSFENSNCREYITEKLFDNAYGRNILPIVMGAHPDDYAKMAPERSYIHVDDFASAEKLAEYLRQLSENDDLYNSYFQWKGTGEFINAQALCRMCALLHDDYPTKTYSDLHAWWWGNDNMCNRKGWR